MRRAGARLVLALSLAAAATLPVRAASGPGSASGPPASAAVAFPSQLLSDGSVVPPHSSLSADPSDAAAARRRSEIVRSPYLQSAERRFVAAGEAEVVFDPSTTPDRRARLASLAEETLRRLFEEARWVRPFSPRSPVTLLLVARRTPGADGPSVAAWERRERGGFAKPLVLVEVEGRPDDAVRLDLARQLALLSARFTSPSAEPWALEAVAEWAGRRAAGLSADPAPSADPLLAVAGSVASAPAAAAVLGWAEGAAGGPGALREAWEAAGAAGSGGEGFLRELASRLGVGPGELIADALSRRSSAAAFAGVSLPAAPAAGESALRAPSPFGWSWFEIPAPRGASDGTEILVAPSTAARAARALLAYRGALGPGDVVPVLPGIPTPLATSPGGGRLLVVGGGEEGSTEPSELRVSIRPLAGYPAAVEGLAARRAPGRVEVSWRTASHRDLLAWLVVRESGGEQAASSSLDPLDLVPTTDVSDDGMSYLLVDRLPPSGALRYHLWALTVSGTLADRGVVEAVDEPD